MTRQEQKIEEDLRQSIKEKNQLKTATLRLLKSSFEREKKTGKANLSDDDVLKIIRTEVKKRKEANEGFKQGGREELAKQELEEMAILLQYLPPELNEADLGKIIDKILADNSFGQQDFGQVMKLVMAETKGQADGSIVSTLVKQKLSK